MVYPKKVTNTNRGERYSNALNFSILLLFGGLRYSKNGVGILGYVV